MIGDGNGRDCGDGDGGCYGDGVDGDDVGGGLM